MIAFVYRGKPRIVEAHRYGVDRGGRVTLVAVQVAGLASAPLPCWRSFREAEMRGLSILPQRFAGPRVGYGRDDGAFATLYAQR